MSVLANAVVIPSTLLVLPKTVKLHVKAFLYVQASQLSGLESVFRPFQTDRKITEEEPLLKVLIGSTAISRWADMNNKELGVIYSVLKLSGG